MLQISGLARSTFYYYLKHRNANKYEKEKQEILDIFNANKGRQSFNCFCYTINRKNDKYYSYKGEVGKVADNLLKRDFYAANPFKKLTTDITQFKVCDEKAFLSPIMDLFNREIILFHFVKSKFGTSARNIE